MRRSARSRRASLAPLLLAALAFASLAPASGEAPRSHPKRSTAIARGPARATAALGLDLLRQLGTGNSVVSPDSVAAALAMAGTGAAGRTAAQIAHVLHLASPAAFAAVGRLQSTLAAEQAASGRGDAQAPTLDIADGLFLQSGFLVRAPFLATLQTSFSAAPQSADFEHDSAGALRAINAWVSSHTHGVIPKILSELARETRLVLANAMYLKAAWASAFHAGATHPGPFHAPRGATSVPFMHETETLPYAEGPGYAAVALPYRASTLSLLVVLPRKQGVAALERRLDPALLARIAGRLRSRPVALSLPRFHLALLSSLNGPLKALGMTDALRPGVADFSRIAPAPPLSVGQVEHAADFRLDEQGTIAAASTVVTIEVTAVRVFPRPPIAFDADRPFLFFLRDDRSGAVLFAGRLVNPAAAQR
jgi:serpin B